MVKTSLKDLLSPGELVRKLSVVARRFPLAVAAVVSSTTLALFAVYGFDEAINYRWWLFLWFAIVSSVAVTLAFEERWPKTGTLLATLAVAALWGVRCLFYPAEFDDFDDMGIAQWVELGVICGTAFFAIFFTAFLRRATDAQWWNFSLLTVVRLVLGSIFSGILFGGLVLAIYASGELFNFSPPDEIFGSLAVACFMLFAPLYVLAGVPGGDAKRDDVLQPEPVLKVFGLYILGSILAVYVLILYVYLAKIILTWELPEGWVSWLVTVLGVGGLAMTLLLYPHRMRSGNRIIEFLSRWMGVIIVPLLLLMTVGIARRVSDYGWTPNRAYILLLNLWFYGIYIWLTVVRGRRVKWILISGVVVALVSSVGPWSLAGIPPAEDKSRPEAEAEDYGRWFSSDSTIVDNIPLILEPKYDKFVKIRWNGSDDNPVDRIGFYLRDGDLVISLPEGGTNGEPSREFRLPIEQLTEARELRGEDFLFWVDECYGDRYETRDLEVSYLVGYLFYTTEDK